LEKGVPMVKIAQEMNVSRVTIFNSFKKEFPGESYNLKKWNQFVKLWQTGMFNRSEVASFLQMTTSSIQRFIKQYNELRCK